MRRPVPALSLLLTLVVAVAGCGSEEEPQVAGGSPAGLPVGRAFNATGASEGGRDRPLPAAATVSFLPDGRTSVATGCNGAQGKTELRNGRLVSDGFGITEMACMNPGVMEQETFVMSVVDGRPEVLLDGDVLVLRTAAAEIRFLDRRVAEPDRPLEGTRWRVDGHFDPQVAGSAADGAGELILSEGRVRFTSACRHAEGQAALTGTTITVGPLTTSSARPCTEQQQRSEGDVLRLLAGPLEAVVSSAHLRLTRPDGAGLDLVEAR